MEKIRVLAFIIGMNNGGAQKIVLDNAINFTNDKEIDFRICSIHKYKKLSNYEKELKTKGIKVQYATSFFDKILFILKPSLRTKRIIKLCKKKIKKNQPDIVHVHLCGAMLYVAQAAEECNVPLRFYTLHSNPFRQTGEILTAIQSAFTSQSFTALCLNNLQYNQAKDYYHIKKYEILRNGINFQKIRKIAIPKKNARKLFELDESDFVISCVGRLDPIKNYSFMLDVMNLVLKKQPKAKLIFAGDGSERQKLETKAVTLGIRQNIKFLGNMQNVIPVYCASDVFCLTSINEASPLVLLEAQAVNVYSVVSAGVPEESIVSDKVCHMKEGSTVDEWANAVLNENFIGKPVCTEEECDVNNATKNLKAIYMKYYKELKSNEK